MPVCRAITKRGEFCELRCQRYPDKTKPSERFNVGFGGFIWYFPEITGNYCYYHQKMLDGLFSTYPQILIKTFPQEKIKHLEWRKKI